jgi:hypothetical protein
MSSTPCRFRSGRGWLGLPTQPLQHLVHAEALPHVSVRHDEDPRPSEVLVAPGVIPIHNWGDAEEPPLPYRINTEHA